MTKEPPKKKTTHSTKAKALPAARMQSQGTRLRHVSASFQIRTPPEIKARAERLADDHDTGRSKLDAVIYARGLWITALVLGPGKDGSYAGLSEMELARKLESLFDRQYAVLDQYGLLASYVYRVVPPNGGMTFLPGAQTIANGQSGQKEPTHDEQSHYQLSGEANTNLENFAEEL